MNQAQRLLNIFESLAGRGANQPMTQIWTSVFEIDAQSENIEDDITVCLLALRGEITSVEGKLAVLGVDKVLLEPGFSRLRSVASPQYISQNWDGMKGNVQPVENKYPFLWAAWALREDVDDGISTEDRVEIETALTALETALAQSSISPYLRQFVQRQVVAIRDALRIARIQGSEPLRDAMRKFAGDMKVEETKFRDAVAASPAEAKITLTALSTVVEKAAKICDGAKTVWNFTQSVGGALSDLMLPYVK